MIDGRGCRCGVRRWHRESPARLRAHPPVFGPVRLFSGVRGPSAAWIGLHRTTNGQRFWLDPPSFVSPVPPAYPVISDQSSVISYQSGLITGWVGNMLLFADERLAVAPLSHSRARPDSDRVLRDRSEHSCQHRRPGGGNWSLSNLRRRGHR